MSHETVCPKGHRVQIAEEHFGRQVRCPTCNESFVAPNLGEMASHGVPPVGASQGGSGARAWSLRGAGTNRFSLATGRPMLAVGLVLVLISRGCDTIGRRAVNATLSEQELAKVRFDNRLESERLEIQKKIDEIDDVVEDRRAEEAQRMREIAVEDDSGRRADLQKQLSEFQKAWNEEEGKDQKKRDELNAELQKLAGKHRRETRDFENGEYRDLENAAEEAQATNQIRGYWRQVFFVFSSIILALGLLIVSWTADGAERWICLIMLAIITLSIYIGGVPWLPGFPV
ncbi:MAG TPA: hypothetical protein VMY42_08500 [Thermoguttaceae bacterium]|nr:hypothetical protein [Thermoguttaceae bacterium]